MSTSTYVEDMLILELVFASCLGIISCRTSASLARKWGFFRRDLLPINTNITSMRCPLTSTTSCKYQTYLACLLKQCMLNTTQLMAHLTWSFWEHATKIRRSRPLTSSWKITIIQQLGIQYPLSNSWEYGDHYPTAGNTVTIIQQLGIRWSNTTAGNTVK